MAAPERDRRRVARKLARVHAAMRSDSLVSRLRSHTPEQIAMQHYQFLIEKTNRTRAQILSQIPALAALSTAQRQAALECLEEVKFPAGTYIIREGEIGREFFIIARGFVNVMKRDPQGEDRFLVRLGPDRFFGEIAMLIHEPRTASVVAVDEVTLLKMTRAQFNEILAPVHGTLRDMRREVIERKLLARVPVFQCLTALQRKSLVERMELAHFGNGDFVCRQNMVGDSFYIITHGTASISIADKSAPNGQRQVAQRHEWEHFGDGSLLEDNARRNANVVAKGDLTCLRLCKYEFLSMLKSLHNQLSASVVLADPAALLERQHQQQRADAHADMQRSPAEMLVSAIRSLNDAKMCGPKRIKAFMRGMLRRLRNDMYLDVLRRAEDDADLLERVPMLSSQLLGLPAQLQRDKLGQMVAHVLRKSFSARSDEEVALVDLVTERCAFRHKYCDAWDPQQCLDLCARMSFAHVPGMSTVFAQDTVGTTSYIILRGTVRIWQESHDRGARRREVLADLAPGESFGDLALLGVTQRSAHALAISDCELLVIEREDYRRVETLGRSTATALGSMAVEDKYQVMQRMALFAKMDVYKLYRLAFVVEERSFHKGQTIVARGGHADALFFIMRGTVHLEVPHAQRHKKPMRIASINEFEFFGESGILRAAARVPDCSERADVVAGTHVLDVLVLQPADYKRLDAAIVASLQAQNAQRQAWFQRRAQELKKTRNRIFAKGQGGHLVLRDGQRRKNEARSVRSARSKRGGQEQQQQQPSRRRPATAGGSPPPPLRRAGGSPIPMSYRPESPEPVVQPQAQQPPKIVIDVPGGDQRMHFHSSIHGDAVGGGGGTPRHWFRARGWHEPPSPTSPAKETTAKKRPATAPIARLGPAQQTSAFAFGSPYSTLPSVVGPAVTGTTGDAGGVRSARAQAVGIRPLSAYSPAAAAAARGDDGGGGGGGGMRPRSAAVRNSNEDTIKRLQAQLASMNGAAAALAAMRS